MSRWLVALVLVGCGPSQQEICDRVPDRARDECMTKKWTEKQADCVLRAGYGSMQSMFCFD
jgi:hypothetical protein